MIENREIEELNSLSPKERGKKFNQSIREMLEIPNEGRSHHWWDMFYNVVKEGYFEIKGAVTGPDDRNYICAQLCDDHMINGIVSPIKQNFIKMSPAHTQKNQNATELQIVNFSSLALHSYERLAGIAIIVEDKLEKRPDAILRFGAVWSFIYYQELAGCANVIYDYHESIKKGISNPLETTVSDSDKIRLGKPSEEFFPSAIRRLIEKEIKKDMPEASVEFNLYEQECYAMPFSILLSLGLETPNELKNKYIQKLVWYMPPYLPLTTQ